MKFLNGKLSIFLIFFIILIFSLSWPLILPAHNWPTDYGHHFYISMTNSDQGLYKDFFTHKGPVLVLFIDILQFFFGTTWRSSISVLILLTLFFLSTVAFTSYKITKNNLLTIVAILYTIFFFRYQTSDVFVDLINVPLILLANLYLFKAINRDKKEYIFFYIFFISLSFFSRVDTLIYLFISTIFLLFFILKEKKINFLEIKFILKNISIFLIIFILFSFIYKFNLKDFIYQNFIFNMMYAEDDYRKFSNLGSLFALIPYKHYSIILIFKLIYFIKLSHKIGKKDSIIFSILTVIQFLIFIQKFDNLFLFFSIFIFEIFYITFLIINNKSKNYELLFVLLLNFSSFFIYLFSGSYKLNHSFILIPGTLIFSLYFLKNTFKENTFYKNLSFLILILLFFYQSEKIHRYVYKSLSESEFISLKNDISNYFYDHTIIENNDLVKIIKNNNTPIICGRGWLHIFSNTKSRGLMFDWWMYDDRKKIKFSKHDDYIRNLIKREYGDYFLINSECVNNKIFSGNIHISTLLQNSYKINELKHLNNVSYHYRKLK